MFEELNNDLKLVRDFTMGSNIGTVMDVTYTSDDVIESLKAEKKLVYCRADLTTATSSALKTTSLMGDSSNIPAQDLSVDIAISRNTIHYISDFKQMIKECARILKPSGLFILIATVVDIEDAFLNTIEFQKDNKHIRYFTVSEILSVVSEYFSLAKYERIDKVIAANTWLNGSKDKRLLKQFNEFPENIKKSLKLEFDSNGQLAGLTTKSGVFILNPLI